MKLTTTPVFLFWGVAILLLTLISAAIHFIIAPANATEAAMYYGSVVMLFLIGTNLFQLHNTNTTAAQMAAAQTEAIAEQTALFEELYRNSPVPYLRVSEVGNIISVNSAMLHLFKVEEGQLDNVNIFELIAATDETQAQLLSSKVSRGQFLNEIEVTLTDSEGQSHWALLFSFPYGHDRERLLTLFDITKQKEVDMAKSEFVSLASHQLRTPISALRWNLELLENNSLGPLSDAQREYIDKIARNTEKMHLIINDFLSVSQLEMGTFATEVTEVPVNDFLEEIYEEFHIRITQKDLTLIKQYEASALTISTDKGLLHNIISNLVSNAVKYTPTGGSVTVSYTYTAKDVVFTIADSGMGIPQEEQDSLFTKFFRASNAKSEVTEGTGLGLYIVAKATDYLGGTISVSSAAGQGSVFTVTIPRVF